MTNPKRRPGRPKTTGSRGDTLYVRLPDDLKAWCWKQADAVDRPLSSWVRQQLQAIRAKGGK